MEDPVGECLYTTASPSYTDRTLYLPGCTACSLVEVREVRDSILTKHLDDGDYEGQGSGV